MGWDVPEMEGVKIIVNPPAKDIHYLLSDNRDAWHIFSGFHAYKTPTKAMKMAVPLGLKNLVVITESYDSKGYKGIFRNLKYLWLSKIYQKNIKAIFVTGLPARKCFGRLFFKNEILFDWGYFIETRNSVNIGEVKKSLPDLLFVGTVDKNKNLLSKIPTLIKYKSSFNKFYIVGEGYLFDDLKVMISKEDCFVYLGILENRKITEMMNQMDLLILPSLYDGWGVVVNEALGSGMRVLCSNACGASILMDGLIRGSVFDNQKGDFEDHLIYWLKKGALKKEERLKIKEWAMNHISGSVAANYFTDCIRFLEGELEVRPVAPWI